MKKLLSIVLAAVLVLGIIGTVQAEELNGIAKGFGGEVTVVVTVEDGKIRPPYTSLKGCGESAAVSITEKVAAYNKRGEKFLTVDEFTSKTGAPSNVVTMLQEAGAFGKMAITAQVSFFDDIQ